MSKKPVPDREAPMIDAEGRITPSWLEFFQDLDARAFRQRVSTTTPSDGQSMKYVSSTGLWTPST